MDLDRDGRLDLVSGSYLPAEVRVFPGLAEGRFGAGHGLSDDTGQPLRVGRASWPFAVDWEGDGDLDLVLGNMFGKVFLARNASGGKELRLAAPVPLEAAGAALEILETNASPCVADWDGDGAHDLLLGTGDGSVLFYRNTRPAGGEPVLAAPVELLPPSPDGEASLRLAHPGQRARVAVGDWNADGRLDLLLGEHLGEDGPAPVLDAAQQREFEATIRASVELGERRGALERAALARWLEARRIPPRESSEHYDDFLVEWQASAEAREVAARQAELDARLAALSPPRLEHGRVWVFLRQPG